MKRHPRGHSKTSFTCPLCKIRMRSGYWHTIEYVVELHMRCTHGLYTFFTWDKTFETSRDEIRKRTIELALENEFTK